MANVLEREYLFGLWLTFGDSFSFAPNPRKLLLIGEGLLVSFVRLDGTLQITLFGTIAVRRSSEKSLLGGILFVCLLLLHSEDLGQNVGVPDNSNKSRPDNGSGSHLVKQVRELAHAYKRV